MPRYGTLAALPLIGALMVASQAQAYTFTLSGEGMTASGWFTSRFRSLPISRLYVRDGPTRGLGLSVPPTRQRPDDYRRWRDVLGQELRLNINNAKITGIVANNYLPHFAPDPNFPFSFSWSRTGPGGFPTGASTLLSYDNLFYPGPAAPVTCAGAEAPADTSTITACW